MGIKIIEIVKEQQEFINKITAPLKGFEQVQQLINKINWMEKHNSLKWLYSEPEINEAETLLQTITPVTERDKEIYQKLDNAIEQYKNEKAKISFQITAIIAYYTGKKATPELIKIIETIGLQSSQGQRKQISNIKTLRNTFERDITKAKKAIKAKTIMINNQRINAIIRLLNDVLEINEKYKFSIKMAVKTDLVIFNNLLATKP